MLHAWAGVLGSNRDRPGIGRQRASQGCVRAQRDGGRGRAASEISSPRLPSDTGQAVHKKRNEVSAGQFGIRTCAALNVIRSPGGGVSLMRGTLSIEITCVA